ncbi:hypothetical protein [Hoeflea olei]|uniref:Protein TolA n=1 Tax=Hoeflea olei TaxID=1480615 RepID=A0A1C1Z0U6_9HYPH|nr:hypothetical protein [Hoeflea olei]OCW59297.1 hypothetical protein AWJ14_09625 [Hoeflea olei]
MKGSLATSTVLHVLVLGFALSSFSAPRTLEVADVEALPVSIVPIEEITQMQQGDKTAPLAEIAAPIPTARPDPVADAENAGDNTVDLKSSKSAKPSPQEVVSEAPPKPAEKPVPVPEPAPKAPEPPQAAEAEPAPAPEKPAEPAPAPEEVAALPPESAPDPVAEAITEAEPAKPDFAALPSVGPVPQARPEPPKETAKAPAKPTAATETAKAPAKPAAAAETASTKDSDFNADEVAALLNKQDAKGGGAKRSTETASLGASRTTRGNTLSQSEMDALRGQIQRNWNIIPGMADGGDVRVTVTMKLDPSGNIVGQPDVVATGGSEGVRRTLSGSARRAVLKSQPYQLPQEKYDSWAEVVVNFDPSQMF